MTTEPCKRRYVLLRSLSFLFLLASLVDTKPTSTAVNRTGVVINRNFTVSDHVLNGVEASAVSDKEISRNVMKGVPGDGGDDVQKSFRANLRRSLNGKAEFILRPWTRIRPRHQPRGTYPVVLLMMMMMLMNVIIL